MLETKRLFRNTSAFIVLILLSILGLLLYLSEQLDGQTFREYTEKNSVYHATLQEANRTRMDYDRIHQEQQELTIRAVLNTPDNYLYDIYLEAYPDYAAEKPDEATKQIILKKEWAYTLLDQQAAYHQTLSSRLPQMESEFRQKTNSKLFSKNKDLLRSMEKMLRDYQSLANIHLSYGDDRFILSVLYNRANIALLLILSALVCLSYVCFSLNGNSKYVFLKYCNLITCLSPLDLIRQYRLLNVFNLHIHMQILVLTVFTAAAVILTALVLLKSGKPYPCDRMSLLHKFLSGIRNHLHFDFPLLPSLWEHLKLIMEGKIMLVFAAAILFAFSFQLPALHLNNEELLRQAYYQQLNSESPEQALPLITENLAAIKDNIQCLRQEYDKKNDFLFAHILEQYSAQQNVLESLLSEAEEMEAYNKEHKHPKVFFDIYQADALLGIGEKTSGRWRALGMLMLIIFVSSVCFPMEKQSNTIPLIVCSRKGIAKVFRIKILALWIEVFLITLCFIIPEGIKLWEIVPPFSAAQGVPCLKETFYDLSITGYWGLLWGCRLLILLGISSAVMIFSFLFHTAYAGIVMSESVFGLPSLLPVLFPAWNIEFLPISLLLSRTFFMTDMTLACVIAVVLCALLFFMVDNPRVSGKAKQFPSYHYVAALIYGEVLSRRKSHRKEISPFR